MYTVYCTVLLFAIWGVPLLAAAAQAGADGRLRGPVAEAVPSALRAVLPAVLATVVLLPAERARWQGPVLLEPAALSWLLPQPVLRRALLLPRFVTASVTATVIGAAAGAVAGFLLHALGAGSWWAATCAGAGAGAVAGFAGTALATSVQRHSGTGSRHVASIRRTGWTVAAALWLLAAAAPVVGSWATWAVLWSGPWGWATLPPAAVAGEVPAGAGWAGAVLSALVLTAAGRAGAESAARIPARVLRAQADTALRVRASLYSLDLRQARAAVRATSSRTVRPTVRLPLPRRRWLLVPWRDATALLRSPGRPAWAAVWAAVAVVPLCLDGAPLAVVLMTLPSGYLAAAHLVEPARLESDDARCSAHLPWPARVLALWHGVVPAAGLLTLFLLGGSVAAVAGLWSDRLLVLPVLVPALVGAALVSAYRGVVPAHLMVGSATPLGDTGPLAALVWQVRGPLVALGALTVVDGPVRGAEPDAVGLLWPLLVGVGMAWWAGATARRTMLGR
ncbi:DUF6297 family protein [Streptomyces zingiberis]|uniref:ABC transporter permease n=1 Tax=Streptomyces zingiberis TaxID=2053010 RepID=A0ABX1C613_9ACTN|nr:DUF6297 family protein [Streptomyces zingiberis]NJQ03129.1 hypothetical protein [Streptomyces zingiberis]